LVHICREIITEKRHKWLARERVFSVTAFAGLKSDIIHLTVNMGEEIKKRKKEVKVLPLIV
jgi:hypothetical protein